MWVAANGGGRSARATGVEASAPARLRAEFTQEELARRAQLDPKHVQSVEAGGANVTVSTLLGLAAALECGIAELFEGTRLPAR